MLKAVFLYERMSLVGSFGEGRGGEGGRKGSTLSLSPSVLFWQNTWHRTEETHKESGDFPQGRNIPLRRGDFCIFPSNLGCSPCSASESAQMGRGEIR